MPLIDEPTPYAAGAYLTAIYNNSLFYLRFYLYTANASRQWFIYNLISNLLAMWRGSFELCELIKS